MINTDLLFKLNSFCKLNFMPRRTKHCAKIVRIRSFSGPSFSAFRLNTEIYCKFPYSVRTQENTGQKNLEYGHFLRSVILWELVGYSLTSTKSFWNLHNQRRHSALRSVVNSSEIISEKTGMLLISSTVLNWKSWFCTKYFLLQCGLVLLPVCCS